MGHHYLDGLFPELISLEVLHIQLVHSFGSYVKGYYSCVSSDGQENGYYIVSACLVLYSLRNLLSDGECLSYKKK